MDGSEEVVVPLTEVEPEVMVVKVMAELSVSLQALRISCKRVSIVLRTSAGAAPTRIIEKPTYFLLWHFHPFLVYPSTQERQ